MKTLSAISKTLNCLVGVFFIPLSLFGLMIATNSSKGWNISDPDGKLFIPVGIFVLILAVLWLAFTVIRMITKKFKFFEPIFFGIGLLAYGAYWLISSMIR